MWFFQSWPKDMKLESQSGAYITLFDLMKDMFVNKIVMLLIFLAQRVKLLIIVKSRFLK